MGTQVKKPLSAIAPTLATIGYTFKPIQFVRYKSNSITYVNFLIFYVYRSFVARS